MNLSKNQKGLAICLGIYALGVISVSTLVTDVININGTPLESFTFGVSLLFWLAVGMEIGTYYKEN